jgi:hypothetical membrane protein
MAASDTRSPGLTAILALAGLVAPLWFTTLVIVQGWLQPDYSHVAMPVSALAAWPAGWIQNLNFFVNGGLLIAFAIGLQLGIRPTRRGAVGIALLLASGVGNEVAGLFPWRMVDGVPTESASHVVGALLSFLGASVGLMATSRRMAADPQWRDLASYTLATGAAMLLLFVALGAFAIGDGTPLHPWAGLLQRVIVVFWFVCVMILAARLRRVST